MGNSLDEKIKGFVGYVSVRQLGIAEHLAREFANKDSDSPLIQSGYAILSIVLSYFEMIQQFTSGKVSGMGDSTSFFYEGFRKVYPTTPLNEEMVKQRIYKPIRCGMYHSALTKGRSPLSREFKVGFKIEGDRLEINPALVVAEIRNHFESYKSTLEDLCEVDCRNKFESVFDQISCGWFDSTTTTTSSTTTTKTTSNPSDDLPAERND